MRKINDLTGKQFGKLTVLHSVRVPLGNERFQTKWLCRCNCGNEKLMNGADLTSGKSQSCRNCHNAKVSVGQRYGKLLVLESVKIKEKYSSRTMWRCACDCSNEVIVRGSVLLQGKSDCGKCLISLDLTGRKFGRLTVLYESEQKGYWTCECECRQQPVVRYANLLNGTTQSCGCLSRELVAERNKQNATHHMTNTRLHNIWDTMKARCYRPHSKDFKNYGARGINICEEWKSDFLAFYEWAMANGYEEHLSIDRKDVNGNYEPDNCRWATTKEQGNNTRVNRHITIDGETRTIAEWADIAGISPKALRYRIEAEWSNEELLLPVGVKKGKEPNRC